METICARDNTLTGRLARIDRGELCRALRLSTQGLQARLDGIKPMNASQAIIIASFAGLPASTLLQFTLDVVHELPGVHLQDTA